MKGSISAGIKFVSALLILGGAFGILVGLWTDYQVVKQRGFGPSVPLITTGLCILLFGWCVYVGFSLWRNKPEAYKWAKMIFSAQIPVFTFPGFYFSGFYTGLVLHLMLSRESPNLRFYVGLTSSMRFVISEHIQNVLVGVKCDRDPCLDLPLSRDRTRSCAIRRQIRPYLGLAGFHFVSEI